MREMTTQEEEGLKKAFEMAGIKNALLFANSKNGQTIFYKCGDDKFLLRLLAGLCKRHTELFAWFVEMLRISAGAKSVDIDFMKPPGAEA
jgi:hypothetical protein